MRHSARTLPELFVRAAGARCGWMVWFGWGVLWVLILEHGFGLEMKELQKRISTEVYSSPQPLNVVLFSATGRVGSTNLLSMLQGKLRNIGEIFISFPSRNLPPNPSSPHENPSDGEFQQRLQNHIQRSFASRPKEQGKDIHLFASIKFWHAWSNGVTVRWLAQSLITYGSVTHFLLITRNPIRITVSEQYGHRYHSWSYDSKNTMRSISSPISSVSVCDRSYLAYHIGGRWMSQMAVTHYNSFLEILSLIPNSPKDSFPSTLSSPTVSILGLSYEADILKNPQIAYRQILKFLGLPLPSASSLPSSKLKKGMSCLLSSMLINYEELLCTFSRYDTHHSAHPIAWMATDDDRKNDVYTYSKMMRSWKELSESSEYSAQGYLPECNLREILTLLPSLQVQLDEIQSPSLRFPGHCAVGGHLPPSCPKENIQAIPSDRVDEFCLLSLYRSSCDLMTVRNGRCYLHSNRTDVDASTAFPDFAVRLEPCEKESYTTVRKESLTER